MPDTGGSLSLPVTSLQKEFWDPQGPGVSTMQETVRGERGLLEKGLVHAASGPRPSLNHPETQLPTSATWDIAGRRRCACQPGWYSRLWGPMHEVCPTGNPRKGPASGFAYKLRGQRKKPLWKFCCFGEGEKENRFGYQVWRAVSLWRLGQQSRAGGSSAFQCQYFNHPIFSKATVSNVHVSSSSCFLFP